MDATAEDELKTRFGIEGFPTLKFSRNGVDWQEYDLGRTKADLIRYCMFYRVTASVSVCWCVGVVLRWVFEELVLMSSCMTMTLVSCTVLMNVRHIRFANRISSAEVTPVSSISNLEQLADANVVAFVACEKVCKKIPMLVLMHFACSGCVR